MPMASKKENFKQERQEMKEVRDMFRMNLDTAYKMVTGEIAVQKQGGSDSPAGESQWLDKDHHVMGGKVIGPETQHLDWDNIMSKIGYTPQQSTKSSSKQPNLPKIDNNEFSPIFTELSKFSFSNNADKRKSQIIKISQVLRNSIAKATMTNVATSTKAVYPHMEKFSYTDSGEEYTAKVIFNVDKYKISIEASGKFAGDEVICLEKETDAIAAHVVRDVGDSVEDVTNEFKIKLGIL